MKADLSRHSFRQRNHYTKVLSEQGRLTIDADSNEQLHIQAHLDRTTNVDVIGRCGAPVTGGGYALAPTADGRDLFILPGRLYVDGILCEMDLTPVPFALMPDTTTQVRPGMWSPDGRAFAQDQRVQVFDEAAPDQAPLEFQITAADAQNDLLTLSPATAQATLQAFVQTALEPRMQRKTTVTTQPDSPGFVLPSESGRYLAYLDVWERHITALDNPAMREVALPVPDTSTRMKTVWQVKLLSIGDRGSAVGCRSQIPAWDALTAASTGEVAARGEPDASNSDPCIVPARAGYRRLENQLYRVEIHDGGTLPGTVTFKWSRDNGTVVARWGKTDGSNITVSSAGQDSVLGFAPGQWVELFSDKQVLYGLPGTLVRLLKVDGTTLTIDPGTATGSVDPKDFPGNPQVRRWDSAGRVPVVTGTFLPLEDGVQAQFAAGTYRTGDYWMIPARTATQDVEWPRDDQKNPVFQPAGGIRHHYCRLAILESDGERWTLIEDCRQTFPPLTGLPTAQEDPGVHITAVQLRRTGSPLRNDADVFVNDLATGIDVICDRDVDPATIKQPTCFVTLDLPYPLTPSDLSFWEVPNIGFQPIILDGTPSVAANRIVWAAAATTQKWLEGVLFTRLAGARVSRILAHLTIKGNFVWAPGNPGVYLDGEAFGVRTAGAGTTDIRFPTGNGRRGGDFEMWFWLSQQPILSSFVVAPTAITAARPAEILLTASLTGPAPAGGATVTLKAAVMDVSGAVLPGVTVPTIPASITIPEGQSSRDVKVSNPRVPGPATIAITATSGGVTMRATVTIRGTGRIPGGNVRRGPAHG